MAYSDKVIDHYTNPRNVGTLDKSSHKVGTGLVGAPECGDVMRLQIEVDENNVITDAKFKTFGCGSASTMLWLLTIWTLLKNWLYHRLKFTALYWPKMPSKLPLTITA
jgi:nitrogen fixation NifU-like protein